MTRHARTSFAIMTGMVVLVAWLGLATPLLAALFSYFALQKFRIGGSKTVALGLFTVAVLLAAWGFYHFFHQALVAFPKIAQNAIPAAIRLAKEYGFQLPFTDLDSLKAVAVETVTEQIRYVGRQATTISKNLVMLIVGFVVAVSLFVSGRWQIRDQANSPDNLYVALCSEVAERFKALYGSFATVMGAQIVISAINTTLTAVFILWIGLPYKELVIAVTFFCGLLPIIGNIISNTVIVSIAFTIAPSLGLWALLYLVVLHKLEYFLNSHIIGTRIKNPMWLTLLALVVAERLMGIPGMILAPVILNYVKVEASKIPVVATEASVEKAS